MIVSKNQQTNDEVGRKVETTTKFSCFGGHAAISVLADGEQRAAVDRQKARLLEWHMRFTCFDPRSELMRLNADPREVVPVSDDLRRLARAAALAAELTGGLVDATVATRGRVRVDDATVRRPVGTYLDSGGIAKGLCADWVAEALGAHPAVAVDCGGDLRITGLPRTVRVRDPFGGGVVASFEIADAGVATSGITKRGRHLIDPRTGQPADTGIVQVTAIAPTALEAELWAKAALLSADDAWLPHGGVLVRDDGSVQVKTAAPPSDGVVAIPRNCQPAGAASGSGTIRLRSSRVRRTTSISM